MKWSETEKFDRERRVQSTCLANYWSVPKGDTRCLLALAGWYKPLTGFCHKPDEITVEPQSRAPHLLHSHRACHSFTRAHCRVSKAQQKTCLLRNKELELQASLPCPEESRTSPQDERLLLNHDTRILGLRRRRIQSGARDEA